ncbi:MAG: metalloregulator ArsR/SmtB family transcription factor [Planctomycetota bacterium]|nr:metalloregulator ArsR/SmtB family transcription factor [Planctomycetota bacterium]MCX8040525.1 metalloregulator ArsR/SmtB family transcription factor [Planctomycetota bacterium]MDW8373286.1 metalloregulator ArsR/SmtB family transcription factor [Planctomycetota bacterium]
MPACAAALRLLADESRLRILHALEREPLTVAELTTVLGLGQSSVSGHLGKLKQAGLIHDVAEGSAHRYRLRDDAPPALRAAWQAARQLSREDPVLAADRAALAALRAQSSRDWVTRVAGSLHREYAPGRTWESVAYAVAAAARLGRCLDVGAGDGALAGLLASAASELVCLDPSPAMVAAGRARCAESGLPVSWVEAAGERLPFPAARFDTVLLLQSLQYVEEPRQVLAEAGRVLAAGGRLIVLTLLAHRHAEAARYGHRHFGFRERDLAAWVRPWSPAARTVRLPPEPRPPRFQSLLLIADKPHA